MNFKLVKENKLIFLCFLIAVVFLFKNLGNIYLWTDEANSALVSRNILKFGYPSNFDGRNIVQHYWYYDGKLKLSPFYRTTTWLHLYLAALSFMLLGVNTFAARFPFALAGLGVLVSFFLFLRRYERDKFIINTAVVLLTFCVPFYLHMRQCRYYSLAALFTLLGAWGYLEFYQQGRKNKFILYSLLLFLSLHSAYLILMLAVAVHFLLFYRRERLKGLLISWGWMSLVVVPVTVFLRLWERPPDLLGWQQRLIPPLLYIRLTGYLLYFNDYLIPFALVLIYLIWRWRRRELTLEGLKKNQPLSFIIVLLATAVVFLTLVAPHRFRFVVPYIPFALILLSHILCFFKQRTNRYIAVSILLILISSNLIHQIPYRLWLIINQPAIMRKVLNKVHNKKLRQFSNRARTYSKPSSILYNYLYEITHDYDGPNEGISKYINQHAGKDDIVKATYGDFIYQFYTNRIVIPRGQFENEIMPDWWIFRGPRWNRYGKLLKKYQDVLERHYEKIVLDDYPELPWGNLPEPSYHKFRTVKDAPRVVIYRRKKRKPSPETATGGEGQV
jgi:4-amino-4-deoxy-L-arabinose transferase-like glycosyltransferase